MYKLISNINWLSFYNLIIHTDTCIKATCHYYICFTDITHRIFALILPPFKESVCGFEILGKLAVYINKLENPLICRM